MKILGFESISLFCIIILIGFIAVGITSYTTYSQVIKDDIVNISKLTATNIYSDIRNELTKPIFVSLTMANDNFLKNWLKGETESPNYESHQEELEKYLLGIKAKYNYNSVFLVSETSKKYYHYNGINKVISETDDHDQWYYSFLDSGLLYDLDVDTDEANKNRMTVFINCRIIDDNGKLLGVTGVGLEINHVQDLLEKFEDEFQLEGVLFNQEGVIQVYSNSVDIENGNIFDNEALSKSNDDIIANINSLEIIQSQTKLFDGYYITRYIEDLNWYLLVKKDTSIMKESFRSELLKLIIVCFIIASGVLIIVNAIIKRNGNMMLRMSKTDLLTNLISRRGFNENIGKVIGDISTDKSLYVFVFDIDNFKNVNDIHGHLVGDNVLREVSRLALDIFAEKGAISRWGGDEFAGYVFERKKKS